MNCRYLLCGFLATLFLPVCIKAAECRPEQDKQKILMVSISSDKEIISVAKGLVSEALGQDFQIVGRRAKACYREDTIESQGIIVIAFATNLERFFDRTPDFIAQNPKKILILLANEKDGRIAIADSIKELFQGNIFVVNYIYDSCSGYSLTKNDRYERAVRPLRNFFSRANEAPSKQVAAASPSALSSKQEPAAIPGYLLQALDQFTQALSAANQRVEALRQENLRLTVQTVEAVRENGRLNVQLSEIVRQLAERGISLIPQ